MFSGRNARAAALPAQLSRSWLLASAMKPELFDAALASEADSVIFDIEDAAPAADKSTARDNVVKALEDGATGWVRINDINTEFWEDDLNALHGIPGLRGVMLAKTEKPEHVTLTAMRLNPGTPVLALVESAIGIENATSIASAPGTFRLAFGVGDFRRDTGAGADPMALAYARSKLVVASRVGQLPGPIDGPTLTDSENELLEACKVTQNMGMTGKLTLRIDQTDPINRGLSPSHSEIEWAAELLDSHEHGGGTRDGSYAPRLARAQKIRNLGESYGLWTV
ncbi:aldolase/citrate lyase family protein [Dermacoccus nishinomiyaensis]|uniref:aldolase/citrate lyase family protein n=1 Tax=Dermacoccus nishinomiyaensis TaxID=1274 RepID=UPI0013F41A2B|nr:CoA ester lyase [Dermacoccus nishinomiyaensis]